MTLHHVLRGITALVLGLFLCGSARADKLDDFKKAAANQYCDAIPYSSERSTCKDLGREKDRVCRDFSCPLDEFKKKVETLATKRKNLAEAKSRNNEAAVKDLEKAIEALEKELGALKKQSEEKGERAKACGEARKAVQDLFEKVRQKVQAEREEELQQYVTTLVKHYVEEKTRHDTPIQQVEQARKKCEQIGQIRY